jgi:hypothetical protein
METLQTHYYATEPSRYYRNATKASQYTISDYHSLSVTAVFKINLCLTTFRSLNDLQVHVPFVNCGIFVLPYNTKFCMFHLQQLPYTGTQFLIRNSENRKPPKTESFFMEVDSNLKRRSPWQRWRHWCTLFSRILKQGVMCLCCMYMYRCVAQFDPVYVWSFGAGLAQAVQCLTTGWTTGRSGFDPRRGQRIFPLASLSRPALGPFPAGKSAAGAWRWPLTPI